MRPDSYRTRSPESYDMYNEEGGLQNNNHLTIKDHALGIIALVFAAIALGAVFMKALQDPQIVDAKIQAGAADAKAEAHNARVDARVAIDEVERMRTQLAAKGINVPKEH